VRDGKGSGRMTRASVRLGGGGFVVRGFRLGIVVSGFGPAIRPGRASPVKHNYIVGDNFGAVFFIAGLIVPGPGLQTAFHIDFAAFFEVLSANIRQFSPGDNIVKFGFFLLLPALIGPD